MKSRRCEALLLPLTQVQASQSSVRRSQQHLQPAGAAVDALPRVFRSPAFREAQSHGVGVVGTVLQRRVAQSLVVSRHRPREDLQRVTGRDLEDGERPGIGYVQGRRVDEDWHVGPVVGPHPGLVSADYDA